MTLLAPLDVQDGNYPAYMDRIERASRVQPGVVGAGDMLISAGSGLQVNIAAGNAYVAQTGAIESGGSSFYNGLYFESSDSVANPYNSVIVDGTNPQIAQIILRIYDITELGIGGVSYGRFEWLNGTPTSGATLANRNGALDLPQSSLRLADVLVPAGSSSSASFSFTDRRPWARGYCNARNNTSGVGVTLNSTVQVSMDPSLSMRVECTGSPIRISLYGTYIDGGGSGTVYIEYGIDGVAVGSLGQVDGSSSITIPLTAQAIYFPSPGSHLIQPFYYVSGGSYTTYFPQFAVEEIVRQNANNGIV